MVNLAKITSKIVGAKYNPGGKNPQNGFDCFSMVFYYLQQLGFKISFDDNFKGFNWNNYFKSYTESENVIDIAVEYFASILKIISPIQSIAGDILFARKNNLKFFSIDAGNGNMLAVMESTGVTLIKKNNFEILKAFKCRP